MILTMIMTIINNTKNCNDNNNSALFKNKANVLIKSWNPDQLLQ